MGLEPRPLLHELDHVAAVDLDHVVGVDAVHAGCHQHLHHDLVARGCREVWRRAQPQAQLVLAGIGDAEVLLGPRLAVLVRGDQAVALEALQGRVHLPDVEGPHVAGLGLELVAQLQAVLRALAQQGKQRVSDTHGLESSIILSILLEIIVRTRGTSPVTDGY